MRDRGGFGTNSTYRAESRGRVSSSKICGGQGVVAYKLAVIVAWVCWPWWMEGDQGKTGLQALAGISWYCREMSVRNPETSPGEIHAAHAGTGTQLSGGCHRTLLVL